MINIDAIFSRLNLRVSQKSYSYLTFLIQVRYSNNDQDRLLLFIRKTEENKIDLL